VIVLLWRQEMGDVQTGHDINAMELPDDFVGPEGRLVAVEAEDGLGDAVSGPRWRMSSAIIFSIDFPLVHAMTAWVVRLQSPSLAIRWNYIGGRERACGSKRKPTPSLPIC